MFSGAVSKANTVLVLALLAAAGCGGPAQNGLEVSQARVRAVIPGQDKTAGYFIVHNSGSGPAVLLGARADGARAVEMHVTRRDGDRVRMQRLQEVVVPAGDTVRFEPGGRHLMLFGATDLGEDPVIVLQWQNEPALPVQFETIPIGGG